MEKEKKGLFGRLLDFWKEKIGMGEMDSIGFWNGEEAVENHFAEMGAVAVLNQQETKKNFWEEQTEMSSEGKGWELLSDEKTEKKYFRENDRTIEERKEPAAIFTAEIFREKSQKETEDNMMGRSLLWKEPVEEQATRRIIPVVMETANEKKEYAEREEPVPKKEESRKEEKQTETMVDIEKLMQEMTKRLWEERESCGRRLRS